MTLVGVRATDSSTGLVAILVEVAGPAMVAVPVTAREGLLLSGSDGVTAPSWVDLLTRTCLALGAEPVDAVLDVDADAALTARIRLRRSGEPSTEAEAASPHGTGAADGPTPVEALACSTGDALMLTQRGGLRIVATERLLDTHRLDLASEGSEARVAAWRQELETLDEDAVRVD
ncbi:bifunctional nuclease [Actinomyces radicidentis]